MSTNCSSSSSDVLGAKFLAAARRDGTRPMASQVLESIKRSVDRNDWETTVSISRRLYANMGVPRGAINLKAMVAVGNAWEPVYKGEDQTWGDQAREWLMEDFYPICNVRGPIYDFQTGVYLDSVAIDRDGDVVTLLTASDSGFPMYQDIPNHLIKSPQGTRDGQPAQITLMVPGFLAGGTFDSPPTLKTLPAAYVYNGVAYNQYGRAFAYYIYPEGMDGRASLINGEGKWVHEQWIIHSFDVEWVEQGRGFPCFSHAVREFLSMMTSQEFEEITQMILSSISLVESNPEGTSDPNDPTMAITAGGDVEEDTTTSGNLSDATPLPDQLADEGVADVMIQKIVGGMVKYFKAGTGSKVEPMAKTSPGPIWDAFQDRLTRVALAGTNVPFSIVWKGNDDNGTSNRVSIEKFQRVIEDRQTVLRARAKRKILYALALAQKTKRIPRTKDWFKWDFTLPPEFIIDDGRMAKSTREDYVMGLVNLTSILASRGGGTPKAHYDQRAEEVVAKKLAAKEATERHKADGIVVEPDELGVFFASGNQILPDPEDDAEEEPTTDPKGNPKPATDPKKD